MEREEELEITVVVVASEERLDDGIERGASPPRRRAFDDLPRDDDGGWDADEDRAEARGGG